MWCITASPLIVATDVRNMTDIMKKVLLNTELIAVNQDYTMPAGNRLYTTDCDTFITNACQVWTRKLSDGSIAVVLYNAGDEESDHPIGVPFERLEMSWGTDTTVFIRDLWEHQDLGNYTGSFGHDVQRHGVVALKMSKV